MANRMPEIAPLTSPKRTDSVSSSLRYTTYGHPPPLMVGDNGTTGSCR